MTQVLLVDDDVELGEMLTEYLEREGFEATAVPDAVAARRLDTRIGPRMGRRRDEIADLGRDFDRMTGQLQILVGSQRLLLHDVSHEPRSHLARLQAVWPGSNRRSWRLRWTASSANPAVWMNW